MSRATISVVVPTRGRPESLARCLRALERQSFDGHYEIVVVDDASPDGARVAEVVARSARARLLRQPRRAGPGAARNAGWRAATGSLVLFTDDDCEPSPGWAAALAERLSTGADVVAGETENGERGPWAAASHLLTDYFTASARVPFAASNNLGCCAHVLAAVPFDESFPDAAGEDRDWCARVALAGFHIHSVPGATVAHRHRMTPRTFWRQQVRYGRGAYRYHRLASAKRQLEGTGFYVGLLRRATAEGTAVAALVTVSQAAIALGFLYEAAAARMRPGEASAARQ